MIENRKQSFKERDMALNINFPDKILAGVHQSYTITSEAGPPQGKVTVNGDEVAHRLIPLGAPKDALVSTTPVMKYKVTFLLAADTAGKSVTLRFQAGEAEVEETREITNE